MAIVMGRLKNKEKTFSLPIIWERDASRKVLKGFTTASKTTQHFVNRYSALIELKRYASRWTKTRRKISPIEWRKMSTFETKNWWISLNTSGKIGPMRDRSGFNEALTKLHRLHRESGEERPSPIPLYQYQKWHSSSSSSSTSWWQWNDSWWSSYFLKSQALLSKLIGLRKSASRWTSWRKKILFIAYQLRSLRDVRRPGLSLSTHLDAMNRGNSDQTSAKNSQNCTVFTVSLETSDLHRFFTGNTRNGTRRLLHPAHLGGSGTIPGGAHENEEQVKPHLSSWKSCI